MTFFTCLQPNNPVNENIQHNQIPNRQYLPVEMQMQVCVKQYQRTGLCIQIGIVFVIFKITD
jgi:hypothetical protein